MITPEQRQAFAQWNAANERARREYRLCPVAACGVAACDHLRTGKHGNMCPRHAGPGSRGAA